MCSFSSLIRSALFLSPLPQGKRGKANPFSRSVSSRVLPSHQASKGEAAKSSSCTKQLFSNSLPAIKGKRSAERRIVQPRPRQVCETRLCAAACRAARRLSALTPAALATGCYPDGSAPEPGFPRRPLTGVSPASPTKRTDMPRLSTLRADRSLCRSTGDPKPPGSGLAKKSARGHRTSHSPFRHAVRNGALHKARCISCNRKRDEVSRKK